MWRTRQSGGIDRREAQVKHEYAAGELLAMAGESLRHNGIVANREGSEVQAQGPSSRSSLATSAPLCE